MGAKPSRGSERLSCDEQSRVLTLPDGVWMVNTGKYAPDSMVNFQFLTGDQRARAQSALDDGVSPECQRAVGCLLGLLLGDALGSPLEFHPVRYQWDPNDPRKGIDPLAGFEPALWEDMTEWRETNRFMLQMGQWTDDGAMALCLADSLLEHGGCHPRDVRLRFFIWLMLGYNNAFRFDQTRTEVWGTAESIGIGGTVGEAMKEFSKLPSDYTRRGTIEDNGNGTIMRNAPIAIAYHHDMDMALVAAECQSKTTHCGLEAADCARLLTWICVRAITTGMGKAVLDNLCDFPAGLYATRCLAAAAPEKDHADNAGKDLADRDWSWRRPDFRYAPTRASENPGYAGSYCMDCLAMALHCVYHTGSFEEALLRAANLCGDADTVAAVTGQLAGAIYGETGIPSSWVRFLERWDDGDTRRRAWLLFSMDSPTCPSSHDQVDGVSWTALGSPGDREDPTAEVSNAPSNMPFGCPCGRNFANKTLLDLHGRRCQ